MTKPLIGWILAWTVLSRIPVHTQVPETPPPEALATHYTDPVNGLTLEQAIERALEQEPALRAARTEIDAARGMRIQAGLRPNPTLSAERREEPMGSDNQTSVGVQWPLDLFRRSGRIAVAEREIEVAQHAVADRERVLAAEVRMQFGVVLVAVREVAVSDDLVAAVRRQLELLSARVDAGASPALERDLLEVELRRFESERLVQAGRADAVGVELKRLLGMAADAPLAVGETLEQVVARQQERAAAAPPSLPDVTNRRADVREAEARVRAADARLDRARRDGRFDMTLFGMYMRMDAGFPQRGFNSAGDLERVRGLFHYAAGGVMVMMPLRNRNQGEIAAAQAARLGAAARQEAAQLAAQADIAAARALEQRAREALAIYTDEARALARRNLDVVRLTYELGRATVFDVVAEQRRFLELERAYTATLREAYEARTALQRALGELR